VVSTGYGRNNVNVENATVILELKAHTYGAVWQTGLDDFTLLDIGGQDSKVISSGTAKWRTWFERQMCRILRKIS